MGLFALFFHFLVFKIPKNEVFFSISFASYFQFISSNFFNFFLNPINDVIFTLSNFFWVWGLHFSNLHINVYHVFDVDFE
jgi:hypothetical protein